MVRPEHPASPRPPVSLIGTAAILLFIPMLAGLTCNVATVILLDAPDGMPRGCALIGDLIEGADEPCVAAVERVDEAVRELKSASIASP